MNMQIVSHVPLAPKVWQMELTGPLTYNTVEPGQFLQVLVGDGQTHVLRRPISIGYADPVAERLTMVYKIVGQGTSELSQLAAGDTVDVLGPLGQGYPLPQRSEDVLIIGGGLGVPPLRQLAATLHQQGHRVHVVLGWAEAADVFWLEHFASAAQNVVVTTDDGSFGVHGTVMDGVKQLSSAVQRVYACGPKPMLRSVQRWAAGVGIPAWISLEERMACGVGACTGCVCQTKAGMRRVCADGPVLPADEVIL